MLKKKFKISVDFFGKFGKPKTIDFTYYQGSLRELLELKEELDDAKKFDLWLQDFLMNRTSQSDKMTIKLYRQMGNDQKNKIIGFILKTFAKGFFVKSEKPDRDFVEKAPSSSMICLILEKTSETMESLLEMTWEQVEYLVEGIIWNLNAQDKKGREKNAQKMRLKNMKDGINDEESEIIKRLEAKMAAKKTLKN